MSYKSLCFLSRWSSSVFSGMLNIIMFNSDNNINMLWETLTESVVILNESNINKIYHILPHFTTLLINYHFTFYDGDFQLIRLIEK